MGYKIIKHVKSILRLLFIKMIFREKIKFPHNYSSKMLTYIGKNVKFLVDREGIISIGDNTYIGDNCKLECVNGNIILKDNVFLNDSCKIVSLSNIIIGSNCMMGPNVGIYDHDHGYGDASIPMNKQGYVSRDVNIGNDVWIGANAVITKGVSIGDRVIVGANSVVVSDLKSGGMYAGVPARLIKEI